MPLSSDGIAALVSIPAALAVIVTCYLFLKHIANERQRDRDERMGERQAREDERKSDRMLWENHLSQTVTVLTGLVKEVGELRRELHEGK